MKYVLIVSKEKVKEELEFNSLKGALGVGMMCLANGSDIVIISAETGEVVLYYTGREVYVAESLKYEF